MTLAHDTDSAAPITGDRVRHAMISAGIDRVSHHSCSMCGYMTAYLRYGNDLYFDAGCDCTGRRMVEPRDWDSAARWIEMQSDPEHRARLLKAFGFNHLGMVNAIIDDTDPAARIAALEAEVAVLRDALLTTIEAAHKIYRCSSSPLPSLWPVVEAELERISKAALVLADPAVAGARYAERVRWLKAVVRNVIDDLASPGPYPDQWKFTIKTAHRRLSDALEDDS